MDGIRRNLVNAPTKSGVDVNKLFYSIWMKVAYLGKTTIYLECVWNIYFFNLKI